MEKSFEEKLTEAREHVPALSPQEALQKTKNTNVLFIDPRNETDIRSTTGIIPGALNVTLIELNEKPAHELPQELADRTRPIITACQAGPMGALAAYTLKKRGFNNVYYLDGGTQSWLDAGFSTH